MSANFSPFSQVAKAEDRRRPTRTSEMEATDAKGAGEKMNAGDVPVPTTLSRTMTLPGAFRVQSSQSVTPLARAPLSDASDHSMTEDESLEQQTTTIEESSLAPTENSSYRSSNSNFSLFKIDDAQLVSASPVDEHDEEEQRQQRLPRHPQSTIVKAEPVKLPPSRKHVRTVLFVLAFSILAAVGLVIWHTRSNKTSDFSKVRKNPAPAGGGKNPDKNNISNGPNNIDMECAPGLVQVGKDCLNIGDERRIKVNHFAVWGSTYDSNVFDEGDTCRSTELPTLTISCAAGQGRVKVLDIAHATCTESTNEGVDDESTISCEPRPATTDSETELPVVIFCCTAQHVDAEEVQASVTVSPFVGSSRCSKRSFLSTGPLCRSEATPRRPNTPFTSGTCVRGEVIKASAVDVTTTTPIDVCIQRRPVGANAGGQATAGIEAETDYPGGAANSILHQCLEKSDNTLPYATLSRQIQNGALAVINTT